MSYSFADGGELRFIISVHLSLLCKFLFSEIILYVFFFIPLPELRCSGPDWYEFGEFCYKPFGDKKTWRDARHACRNLGAELVSIQSMTEQSWLESYLYTGMDLVTQNRKKKTS